MLNYTAISVNFITHDSQSAMHKDAEHPINLTLELWPRLFAIHQKDAEMNHYLCTLESGRDFVIKAPSHYDAAYIADDESKLMDDYLVDVIPIDDTDYVVFIDD